MLFLSKNPCKQPGGYKHSIFTILSCLCDVFVHSHQVHVLFSKLLANMLPSNTLSHLKGTKLQNTHSDAISNIILALLLGSAAGKHSPS